MLLDTDPGAVRRRAQLFAGAARAIHVQGDRMFAAILFVQWLASIGCALWISPRTWIGGTSAIHVHVIAAIVLGGIITSLPVCLAIVRPGATVTRHAIAIGQMLTSALLIHLSGGRIETHFHVFVSLAFLAFYRDWKVLQTATLVIIADHIVRGLFWPQSVYGVSAASPWRAFEHAGWVLFEDAILIYQIRHMVRSMHESARDRAGLEIANDHMEHLVATRTADFARSEARFRTLSASSPVGLVETDLHAAALYGNPKWLAISGLEAQQTLGHGWFTAVHPEDRMDFTRGLNAARRREAAYDSVLRVRTPSGVVRWVQLHAVPLRDDAGTMTGWVSTIEDISALKLAEAELVRAREEAIASARLKSEFLANMSHEIRTPMNGIVGMTQLALRTKLDAEQRDYLETVRASSDSLLTVINDILDFSKIEAGRLDIETIPFSLRDHLGAVLKSVSLRCADHDLELVYDVPSTVPDRLRGDPVRIRQVLLNLIGNAIKFTEAGEVVLRVRATPAGAGATTLEFAVIDSGIGIPADKQALVFEAFRQADGSTSRRFGGTGLGLAISRQLVELMAGTIRVESQPGVGSTFAFVLTLGLDADESPAPPRASGLAGVHVLLLESHATSRRVLAEWLRNAGAHVTECATPEAARRAPAGAVTIVLADCGHADPDLEALASLRTALGDQPPCLLLATPGKRPTLERLHAHGVRATLLKPVLPHELLAAVHRALGTESAVQDDARVSSSARPVPPLRSLRILLAEDQAVNRKVAVRMLELKGHVVVAARDGREALAHYVAESFDLVLMDVQMPEMDGFEATAAIRAHERESRTHVPILALTAHAMTGYREHCLAKGMDGYATKPFQEHELFAAITEILLGQDAYLDDSPEPERFDEAA